MSTHGNSSFGRALQAQAQQRFAAEPKVIGPRASVSTEPHGQPAAAGWQWSQTVVGGLCADLWAGLKARQQTALRSKRQLQLVETVNLGEKRFAAILQVGGQQFLIGGGAAGVSLLARLNGDAAETGATQAATRAAMQEQP